MVSMPSSGSAIEKYLERCAAAVNTWPDKSDLLSVACSIIYTGTVWLTQNGSNNKKEGPAALGSDCRLSAIVETAVLMKMSDEGPEIGVKREKSIIFASRQLRSMPMSWNIVQFDGLLPTCSSASGHRGFAHDCPGRKGGPVLKDETRWTWRRQTSHTTEPVSHILTIFVLVCEIWQRK